jgi:tetratricopeptide (TPR) repeat protein
MLYFKCGAPVQGKQAMDTSYTLNPANDYKNLAKFYFHYGQMEYGMEQLEKALQVSITQGNIDVEVILPLAEYKDHQGQSKESIDLFRLAIQVNPNQPYARCKCSLALLYCVYAVYVISIYIYIDIQYIYTLLLLLRLLTSSIFYNIHSASH